MKLKHSNGLFFVDGNGFIDKERDEAMAANEKEEYYWVNMTNGGRCVKCYKPSVAALVESRAAGGYYRYYNFKKIKTVKPDKVKLKVPRIRGRVKSKGYYQPYDLFERSLEGTRR